MITGRERRRGTVAHDYPEEADAMKESYLLLETPLEAEKEKEKYLDLSLPPSSSLPTVSPIGSTQPEFSSHGRLGNAASASGSSPFLLQSRAEQKRQPVTTDLESAQQPRVLFKRRIITCQKRCAFLQSP